jgi:putative ABC transport system permease protein
MTSDFEIEARPKIPEEHYEAGMILVTPDYFRVAGMVLRKGRFPAASDAADAPRIALINETMARRYFPGEDPIGRRLRWAGRDPWWRIVGVVRDTKGFGVDGPLMPTLYLPHGQGQWGNEVHILLRTAVPPATLAGAARKEIRSWSKQLVIGDIVPMRDLLSDSVAVPRFYLLLVAAFAALALTLAAIGVYGTVSYAVAQRTHEIGVRMALGAARGDVLSMVLRQGLALTLAGAALGLAGAWAATRVLASLLFRVRPDDAAALAGAAVLLIAVTLAAGYLPARRAARVDPIEALRHE